MWTWAFIIIVAMLAVALTFGIRRMSRNIKITQEAIAKVVMSDVERLREECRKVMQERFSENLVLNDLEASAKILSAHVDNLTLKNAFGKVDFPWYYILPVGAYIGELLRVNVGGKWRASSLGGLEMTLPTKGGDTITYPFHKMLKQETSGNKGELYAYLITSKHLDELAGQMEAKKT